MEYQCCFGEVKVGNDEDQEAEEREEEWNQAIGPLDIKFQLVSATSF